jgi:ABC-type glutathione transport system ATPase component
MDSAMTWAMPLPETKHQLASKDGVGDAIVRLSDIRVVYRTRQGILRRLAEVVAVDGVSLSIERGQTLGLVGGTGSGKSTIAQVVMGMLRPTSGTVEIAGHDLWAIDPGERLSIQRLVQVVMQDPYSSLDPRMTVGDIIAEPLTLGTSQRGMAKREVSERVAELLSMVGLSPNRARSYPHQFSGGQRQRIAIARALAPRPSLIVLDEPTSALDVSVRAQILTLLRSLQEELGVTYLIISHDLVTVSYLASEVAVMRLGKIVERGETRALYRSPAHPYTIELLASVPGARGTFLKDCKPGNA